MTRRRKLVVLGLIGLLAALIALVGIYGEQPLDEDMGKGF